jgi:hypothetical protein
MDQQDMATRLWERDYDQTIIEKYSIPARFKPQIRLDLISKGYNSDWLYVEHNGHFDQIKEECQKILASVT